MRTSLKLNAAPLRPATRVDRSFRRRLPGTADLQDRRISTALAGAGCSSRVACELPLPQPCPTQTNSKFERRSFGRRSSQAKKCSRRNDLNPMMRHSGMRRFSAFVHHCRSMPRPGPRPQLNVEIACILHVFLRLANGLVANREEYRSHRRAPRLLKHRSARTVFKRKSVLCHDLATPQARA